MGYLAVERRLSLIFRDIPLVFIDHTLDNMFAK